MGKLTVESALRIVATESDIRIYKLLDSHINDLESQLSETQEMLNNYLEMDDRYKLVQRIQELVQDNERLKGELTVERKSLAFYGNETSKLKFDLKEITGGLKDKILELKAQLAEARAEVERLKKVSALKEKYIERMGFCPDCRDKVDGRCFRCENQRLREALERILPEIQALADTPWHEAQQPIKDGWQVLVKIAQSALNKERTEGGEGSAK